MNSEDLTELLSGESSSSIYVAIGDIVCFNADSADGYVCNVLSSSVFDKCSVQASRGDSKEVPNLHGIQFQVYPPCRYKVSKQYRKLLVDKQQEQKDLYMDPQLLAMKALADAEAAENHKENVRNHGRFIRYGDTIQLRHRYTGKWLHIDDVQASRIEKSSMTIRLLEHDDALAHFRILPRYKVKTLGDFVQINDKVVLESVKSRGYFWHVSAPPVDSILAFGAEVNASADKTAFTIIKSARSTTQKDDYIRCGDFVQLFHKDLSSYLCAEGVFDYVVSEQPHVRKSRKGNVRFAHGSSFAGTYWQIEEQSSSLQGDVFSTSKLMRLRHVLTRRYLVVDLVNCNSSLTHDNSLAGTVFKMHPIVEDKQEKLSDCTCVSIENAQSKTWLNVDEQQRVRQQQKNKLQWDVAKQHAILFTADKRSSGAFCVSRVPTQQVDDVNFAAGFVPILLNFSFERESRPSISVEVGREVLIALRELSDFVNVGIRDDAETRRRVRQNLLRDLKIVDLLVNLLKLPLNGTDRLSLLPIMNEVIKILLLYVRGASRKNLLYISAYHDFLGARLEDKAELSANIIELLAGMMRDNRDIINTFLPSHITYFIDLFMARQDYTYLELLRVLCICNGTARTSNQTTICDRWLSNQNSEKPVALHTFDLVCEFNSKVLYVNLATDGKHVRWVPLVDAVDVNNEHYKESVSVFITKQLELMAALCFGANEFCMNLISRDGGFLPIDVVFTAITNRDLPDSLRATFCSVVPDLFIRVPRSYNISVLTSNCCEYSSLEGDQEFGELRLLDPYQNHAPGTIQKVAAFKDWVIHYLTSRKQLYAEEIDANIFLARVLDVAQQFLLYGLLTDTIMETFLPPLVQMLDGRIDRPSRTASEAELEYYFSKSRFDKSAETNAIVKLKLAGLRVLRIVLEFAQRKNFLAFLALFKATEAGTVPEMACLLEEGYVRRSGRHKKHESTMIAHINKVLYSWQCMPNPVELRKILIDLSKYKYDKLLYESLNLLRLMHESADTMFTSCKQAMLAVVPQSKKVRAELEYRIPTLKMFAIVKQSEKEQRTVTKILQRLAEMCFVSKRPRVIPDVTNQRILESYGVLSVLLNWLRAEAAMQSSVVEPATVDMIEQALAVIEGMVSENPRLQQVVFADLHVLLKFHYLPRQLALTIKQIFLDNERLCIALQPSQIRHIASLVSNRRLHGGIEVLDALTAVVRLQKIDLPLKDHQAAVMKGLASQHDAVIRVLEMKEEERLEVLTGRQGQAARAYALKLVEILAICADSDNDYITSLCHMLVPLSETIRILCSDQYDLSVKTTYLRYLTIVYLRKIDAATTKPSNRIYTELLQNPQLFEMIVELNRIGVEFIDLWPTLPTETRREALVFCYSEDTDHRAYCGLCSRTENDSAVSSLGGREMELHQMIYFLIDGMCEFIVDFLTNFCMRSNCALSDEQWTQVDLLCRQMETAAKCLISYLTFEKHRLLIVSAMRALLKYRSLWTTDENTRNSILEVLRQMHINKLHIIEPRNEVMKAYQAYYQNEMRLNLRLVIFTKNCQKLWRGPNTIRAQLTGVHKYGSNVYSPPGAALPLGELFQHYVDTFIESESEGDRYVPIGRLLHLLDNLYRLRNHRQAKPRDGAQDERMIISILQVLRALVQREICRLPQDWEDRMRDPRVKRTFKRVHQVQGVLIQHQAWAPVLAHLEDKNERIIEEVLQLQHALLFGANREVQEALVECFQESRDEAFFPVMKALLERSASEFKQQRMVDAQRLITNMRRMDTLPQAVARDHATALAPERRRSSIAAVAFTRQLIENRIELPDDTTDEELPSIGMAATDKPMENQALLVRQSHTNDHGNSVAVSSKNNHDETDEDESADARDVVSWDAARRNVELVLSIVAQMCDGQSRELQDYLRDQPDNFLSVNIPAEIISYLRVLCVQIDNRNIDLVTTVIDALSEICTGNQENREALIYYKIIEQVNFVLRTRTFGKSTSEQVVNLYSTVGKLVYAIVEEDGERPTRSALDVSETLDMHAFIRVILEVYAALHHHNDLESMSPYANSEGLFDKLDWDDARDDLTALGQVFGILVKRFFDVDPSLRKKLVNEDNKDQILFFQKNILSIEIVKNDCLQKVNFHCPYQRVLREELKNNFKWKVERTTRDQKISNLIEYSEDIISDMVYTKRLLSFPLLIWLTRSWKLQNVIFTLFTLAINIYMLVVSTIRPGGYIDPNNSTSYTVFNSLLDDPSALEWGDPNIIRALGITHVVISFIVMCTYFLAYHPSFPSLKRASCRKIKTKRTMKKLLNNKDDKSKPENRPANEEPTTRKLGASFFSFLTLFYVVSFGASFAGIFVSPLFYVFHLLDVVICVDMIRYVIKAIKRSLAVIFWICILVLVVSYFFGVIAMLFFRSSFSPDDYMYCSTLYECWISVWWQGIVGLLYINMLPNAANNYFSRAVEIAGFQVAFYILVTALLLGAVLFGSVVDNFSKLRRSKEETLHDMRELCFICNITAYELNHRGKGFAHHVHYEHNMWHYVFYLMRLKVIPPTDYGSIDLHVFKCLKQNNYEFFPLNQARSLQMKQVLTMDNRVNDIDRRLSEILKIHQVQEDRRRHRIEIRKQQRWHQQIAKSMFNSIEGTLTFAPTRRSLMTEVREEDEDDYLEDDYDYEATANTRASVTD